MSPQRHIINRQVLEIHVSEEKEVPQMQKEVLQLYREKLVPIINQQCDQYSPEGVTHRIDQLVIDLGEVKIEEFQQVFAEKLRESIASQKAHIIGDPTPTAVKEEVNRTGLSALVHFIQIGSLPWWAPSHSHAHLHQLLDEQLASPQTSFLQLIQQIGRDSIFRTRFVFSFTESQVLQTLDLLTEQSLDPLKHSVKEFTVEVIKNPDRYGSGHTSAQIKNAFWGAAFGQLVLKAKPSHLVGQSIFQALRTLRVDFTQLGFNYTHSLLVALQQKGDQLLKSYPHNPLLFSFCQQLSRTLDHPLIAQLERTQLQRLVTMLEQVKFLSPRLEHPESDRETKQNPKVVYAVTESQLRPSATHLHFLENQLDQLSPPASSKSLQEWLEPFDENDFLPLENAGLVIFWPFLQRFFTNLGLLEGKKFKDQAAQFKASRVMQYLVTGEQTPVFEGELPLNKVLCGIPLIDPVWETQLTEEDQAIADGLIEAVIQKGPLWKNLSPDGFRRTYLQREGLLRSVDGRWLLQVKKETHDITLERLPWGFGTVKLPWMEALLFVEWI